MNGEVELLDACMIDYQANGRLLMFTDVYEFQITQFSLFVKQRQKYVRRHMKSEALTVKTRR
jgi:hypothetical protein